MSEGPDLQDDEVAQLVQWRRRQALEAGLTRVEARLWAESLEIDIQDLRHLVEKGCPAELLAKVLI